jgi:hypothetical protein
MLPFPAVYRMNNMQSVEGAISLLESQQNVAVTDSIASSSTGNCDGAVNGNDALTSTEGKEKRMKKNRRKKRKSKVTNSDNGYVFVSTHTEASYVGTSVATFLEAEMQTAYMIIL